MISQKLKTIFCISIPVFIAHGLEEYFNGFYNTDSSFRFFFHYFQVKGFLKTKTRNVVKAWSIKAEHFLEIAERYIKKGLTRNQFDGKLSCGFESHHLRFYNERIC